MYDFQKDFQFFARLAKELNDPEILQGYMEAAKISADEALEQVSALHDRLNKGEGKPVRFRKFKRLRG